MMRRMWEGVRRLTAVAVLGGTVGVSSCGGGGVDGLSFPVDQPGPFAVGFKTYSISYDPPDGGPPRAIPIAVWYPADAERTAEIRDPVQPLYFIVQSNVAVVDAPIAPPAYPGGYPVIVHSHGHAAYETHNFALGESLATQGYVVVAPGHVGDQITDALTMVDELDDLYERVYDVRATLDHLENLPAEDPLAGRCNTDQVVVTGHSRGTSTVWTILGAPVDGSFLDARCSSGFYTDGGGCPAAKRAVYDRPLRDPRIVAGIPMAGSGDYFYFGGIAPMNTVSAPVMMMCGTNDPANGAVLDVFNQVTNPPMIYLEFALGCHNLFGSGSCLPSEIDTSVALPAIHTYVHAFARRNLFHDDDPGSTAILDGSRQLASVITFHGR